MSRTKCDNKKTKTTHFSLKISFSCSVQTFMKCRALYTFIGSSIKPFMLINFTRLCSESYIIGGMTDSCLICFSLFCGTWTGKGATVSPIENAQPYSVRHVSAYGNLVHAFVTHKLYAFKMVF